MQQSKTSITLPKPCNESWDNMTPTDRGRHCAMCRKTVVDFTLMNDGEVLDIFRQAKGQPPCGHFLETQLNRDLVDTRYKPSFISSIAKKAAAMLILFQSVTVAALAQQAKKQTVTKQTGKDKPAPVDNKRQICGHVLNYDNNQPIAGTRVQIKGTSIDTVTDKWGMFVITLPDSFNKTEIALEGRSSTGSSSYNNVILEEHMTLAEINANKEMVLYQYTAQLLQEHNIVVRDISRVRTYGGLPVQMVREPEKRSGWHRLTKPFRRHKRY